LKFNDPFQHKYGYIRDEHNNGNLVPWAHLSPQPNGISAVLNQLWR